MDYIQENLPGYPSGYGTGGVTAGEGSMMKGNPAHLLSFATSLGDNLNKPPFLNNLAQYTVNSPALSDPNSALWEYRMIYSVVVDKAAFGASGFGNFMITDQHNSPAKKGVGVPVVCHGCITNIAVVSGRGPAGQLLTDADDAV